MTYSTWAIERRRQTSQSTMEDSTLEAALRGRTRGNSNRTGDKSIVFRSSTKENLNTNVNRIAHLNHDSSLPEEELSLMRNTSVKKSVNIETRKAIIPPPLPPRKNSPLTKAAASGGTLNPNSAGSNVKIFWKNEELGRVHYAALHVPWSFVGALREAAVEGDQPGGFMLVKLEHLQIDDGSPLFPEEFIGTFSDVFKVLFIPSVHEQFNLKGAAPTHLPQDVVDGFKLLVLSERLLANLKQSIYEHMCKMIDEEISVDSFSTSICFQVIRTSIDFSAESERASLQIELVKHAIESLVSNLPESLSALESLLKESCLQRRSDIAVLLFQKVYTYLINSERNDFKRVSKVEIIDPSVKQLENKSKELLPVNPVAKFDGIASDFVAQAGAGFHQGIMLEKLVNGVSKGKRVVWCSRNLLLWKKPHKLGLIQTAKSIKREHIIDINLETNDGTTRTFRLRTNRGEYCIDFRARDPQSALACVSALHLWIGRVASGSMEGDLRSSSSTILPPPPPPKESPAYERAFAQRLVRRKSGQGRASQTSSVILPIPSFLTFKSRNNGSAIL